MSESRPTSPAEYVISLFGGLSGTARVLGLTASTVQGWKERGSIPQKYWKELIAAAALADRPLVVSDFLNEHPAPKEANHGKGTSKT